MGANTELILTYKLIPILLSKQMNYILLKPGVLVDPITYATLALRGVYSSNNLEGPQVERTALNRLSPSDAG